MNIYVGNLSFDATENDIEATFGSYGVVKSVNVIKDRETGRSRGFGFVEMQSREAGLEAIRAIDQQSICGRDVTVNEAKPREERAPRRW